MKIDVESVDVDKLRKDLIEHFEDNTECDVFIPFKKVYPDDSY